MGTLLVHLHLPLRPPRSLRFILFPADPTPDSRRRTVRMPTSREADTFAAVSFLSQGRATMPPDPRRTRPPNSDFAPPATRRPAWQRSPWLWLAIALVGVGLAFRLIDFDSLESSADQLPSIAYHRIAEYPHDPTAYTQGLTVHDGRLFESTGRFGESSLREVDVTTGEVLRRYDLDESIFGEGLCRWQDSWLMLTWRNELLLKFDGETLQPVGEHPWPHEGWGITHDGRRLIVSDGTDRLFFVDPTTFEPTGHVDVTLQGRRLDRLNELEFIDGHVFANVWYRNFIVKIDPTDGRVVAKIDLEQLRKEIRVADRDAVLNGIAYDPTDGSLLVTGKLWPKLYRIRLEK